MPENRIARVRQAIDAMNRGDLEAGAAILDEDVVWVATQAWMGDPVYRGRADVIGLWRTVAEMFDEYRWDIEDAVEEGDHVVCTVRWRGSGRASGADVDRTVYMHWEFRGGLVIRSHGFQTLDEALSDAGMRG